MSSDKVNVGGRPTKYTEDLIEKIDQYIDDFESTGHKFPSRAGLCRWLGIHKSTLYDWEKKNPQFSDSLKHIDTLSEWKAWEGGMSGEYNSTIAKLALANHGYSDKVEQVIDAKVEAKSFSDMYGKPES